MGACACGSSIKSKQIQSKQKFDTFKSENFMLRDYSLTIGLSKSMFEIKTIIHNYRPNDIRLIKRTYEETNVHSHVLTVLKMEVKKDFVEEISLLIEYTRNGFEISLGSLDEIKKICKIENFQTEKVHFARSDLTCTGGLHQILDWAYENRNQEYIDLETYPDYNMGTKLYDYIISLFRPNVHNKKIPI